MPVGIIAGRLIWQAFAASLGVVPVPVVSARTFAVAALGTLILANVLAAGPALVAARERRWSSAPERPARRMRRPGTPARDEGRVCAWTAGGSLAAAARHAADA